MNDKKSIRKNILSKRKSLNNQEVVTKSSLICKKIINSNVYNESKVIYCYSSINNEVLLDELFDDIFKQGKSLALPKVEDNQLIFYLIDNLKKLQPGYFKILEPVDCIKAETPDLVITPGVAFTNNGKRLGYGGGFYDRFFSKYPDVYKIGAAYDFQILDFVPTEEHDYILNEIITN